MNIDKKTVTGLTNYFKDNADIDKFLQSFKNTADLRKILEKTGIDAEEINKLVKKFDDKKGDIFSYLGIGEGDIDLTKILDKLNINSKTVTDITNFFKDKADINKFVQSFKKPAELRKILEKTGIDDEEINNFVGKLGVNNNGEREVNNGGHRESLAFGLIVASFVVLQM